MSCVETHQSLRNNKTDPIMVVGDANSQRI